MVDGIKLNKKNQSGANMCNFQYHASWIMRMSRPFAQPFPSLNDTTTNLPVLWRHISQPRLADKKIFVKNVDQMSGKPAVTPRKDLMNQMCFCWGYNLQRFNGIDVEDTTTWIFFHCRNLCTVSFKKQQKPLDEQVVPQNTLDFLHHQMIRLVTCLLRLNLREFQSQTFINRNSRWDSTIVFCQQPRTRQQLSCFLQLVSNKKTKKRQKKNKKTAPQTLFKNTNTMFNN